MKRMIFLLMLLLCMQTALAESAPADGLYTIGVSSNAKMFKVVDCVLRVEDGAMTAVLTMSGSGYGYLYQGTSAEADSVPRESWTPYFDDADGKHRFAIGIPYLDAELPMASWSIRYEKWYDRTLEFFSSTLAPYQEIAPDGVYRGKIISDTDLNGMECILRSDGGVMQLETEGSSMALPSLDTRVPIEGGWLKVESAGLETYSVIVPDGIYAAQAQTDSALLRFTDCLLTVEDGQMTALLTAKNNSFEFVFPGLAADAGNHPEQWIQAVPDANGAYTYAIPIASLDNKIQLATYSAKKKLWYDREFMIESAALVSTDANG